MILDSSILIADERGRFALQDFFAAYSGESFYLAAITVSELWHGVERAVPLVPSVSFCSILRSAFRLRSPVLRPRV